jgi:hypothetical protein
MKQRVIVISQRGFLVGTQVLDQGLDDEPLDQSQKKDQTASGIRVQARLMAGPKQKLHEIEIVVPENHYRHENVAAWHKEVKKRLKLK